MTFLHKKVGEGAGSFGEDLRDLRESHGMTLETVASATKIEIAILRAFEADRIEDIEDPLYAERHLLSYVRYVGGYEPYFLGRYRQMLGRVHATRKLKDLMPRVRGVRAFDLFVGPQVLAVVGLLCLAGALGGYVLWQAHLVRTPPPLMVIEPIEGQQLDRPSALVRGSTMAEAYVSVNGRDVAVDDQGNFSTSVDVKRGTTQISIIARRRRGSETRVDRRVVYDRPLPETELLDLTGDHATSTATSTSP